RRQCRYVDGPDHAGTTSPVPCVARRRVPRPAQSAGQHFLRAGPVFLLSADGRPSRFPANDLASAGGSSPAAGGVEGLLRRLLVVRRFGGGTSLSGAAHEALGGREGRTHRRRVDERPAGSLQGFPQQAARIGSIFPSVRIIPSLSEAASACRSRDRLM